MDAMVTSKTLATGWLIYLFFFFFPDFGPKHLITQFYVFLAIKKQRQDDPMTTRKFCGMKLRLIRTEFWRKTKFDQAFSRGDLINRMPVNTLAGSTSCKNGPLY